MGAQVIFTSEVATDESRLYGDWMKKLYRLSIIH